MKKTKKLLSIILAAAMLLSVCVCFTANAATGKITLEKLKEAEIWVSFPLNVEAEMKSNLVQGKDYSDFEQWLERLKQNIIDAYETLSLSIEGEDVFIEFNEPEMIDQAEAVFAEYFGTEYAGKCAKFVELVLKTSQSASYRYLTLNLILVGFVIPSPVAKLLENEKYNNQNGVYDQEQWEAFVAIRDRYNKMNTESTTVDEYIASVLIYCEYNEAAGALAASSGFIGYMEAFVFNMPGVIQFFLKPFLKMSICVRNMFNWF